MKKNMKEINTLAYEDSDIGIFFCNARVADDIVDLWKMYKLVLLSKNVATDLKCYSADHQPTEDAFIITNAKHETLFVIDYELDEVE